MSYSLDLYCRECAFFAKSTAQLHEHYDRVHYGFRQPPPVISQAEFEQMGSWPMIRKIHTCIVCLVHYKSIKDLINHLTDAHPPRSNNNLMAQTDVGLLQYWVDQLRSMYGQGIIEKVCFSLAYP